MARPPSREVVRVFDAFTRQKDEPRVGSRTDQLHLFSNSKQPSIGDVGGMKSASATSRLFSPSQSHVSVHLIVYLRGPILIFKISVCR
jgi:hypothetical protein